MEFELNKNMSTSDFVTRVENKLEKDKAYKLFVKAESLRINKEFKLSISEYLKAIFLDRNNPKTLLGIALSYKNTQNFEKALKYLEKAKAICGNDFDIFYNLGIVHLILNNPEVAVENLRQAILLDKKNLNAQIQLAIAHELMQEEDIALAIYQKLIEENPSFLIAYNHKVALLMNLELYTEAASMFRTILKINPDFYRAYLGIALCFDKLKRPQDALRYYKKYISLKPNAINSKRVLRRINEIKENNYGSRQNMPEYLSLI